VKTRGENGRKGQKNSWGKKMVQERAKSVGIWTEKKIEIGNNGL
jgi:hypothetical protein